MESPNDVFDKSKQLARKKEDHKFFFIGSIITLFFTVIVEIVLQHIAIISIFDFILVLLFLVLIGAIIYFIVYPQFTPWFMGVDYKGRINLSIPKTSEDERIKLFEELKQKVFSIAQMKKMVPEEINSATWKLRKNFPGDMEIEIRYEDGTQQIALTWTNDAEAIEVAQTIHRLCTERVSELVNSGLPLDYYQMRRKMRERAP